MENILCRLLTGLCSLVAFLAIAAAFLADTAIMAIRGLMWIMSPAC